MGRTGRRASVAEGTAGAKVLKQKRLAVFEDQGEGNAGRNHKALWCNGKSSRFLKLGMT